MDKRWGEIESIFNKVLEADEDRRSAVLEESCAGDESLKREVESLLAHHGNAGNFIESPAFEDLASANPGRASVRTGTQRSDSSLKGALVAHYKVLEEIGVGGMGIVYKAEDIKLGRPVALKFLPERLSVDSVAVERFRREARAASALNHPNICTIYEIEQHDGREFIAMEFLEGQTLATYVAGRAHSSETVTKLGIPIAEALAAAHSKGVIHRDVKPGNIFVTSSGLVKVLDFGVAKLLQPTDNATTLDTLTETNAITGTLPYMSPEQLRGENLDARSDIYALGVVLYEMSTGRRPYTSSLQGKLIDEILHHPAAAPSILNRKLPPKLDEVILKCLEKDPENRYQTAKEIAVDLRRAEAPSSGQVAAARTRSKTWLWAAPITFALLLAAAVTWYLLPVAQPRVTGSMRITEVGNALAFPIVTDAAGVYFSQGGLNLGGVPQITEVSLNGGDTTKLPNAIPHPTVLDISSDRSKLLVMSRAAETDWEDAELWALPLPVGSPRRLLGMKVRVLGASWSPNLQWLVFLRGNEVWVARFDGTDARRIASVAGELFRPAFAPDSKRIRFSVQDPKNRTSSIWEVRVDGSNLHQILTGWHKPASECCGIWSPDGRYYIFRSTFKNDWTDFFGFGDLYALPDSTGTIRRSTPLQLTFGPIQYSIGGFTADGKKLLLTAYDPRPELTRYDSKSKGFVPFLKGIAACFVSFSRDGKHVAYVKTSDNTLWTSDADGNNRLQLTYPPDRVLLPRWSPDGTQIVFQHSQLGKPSKIALISWQGGTPEDLAPGETPQGDPSWSPDGTRIVFSVGLPESDTQSDIRILDLATRQVATLPESSGKFSPRWSPDGRYLAALDLSLDSKRLFVFDFQNGKWSEWVMETTGIGYPAWTADSRYVVYAAGFDEKRIRVGSHTPEFLFSSKALLQYQTALGFWTDLAPDGSSMFIRDNSTQDIYSLDMDLP